MNELELKYGCNPNQKPARFHEKRRSSSLYGSQRQARLHQPARRLQLVAARARIERGDGPSAAASFKHVSPRARRSACRSTRWTKGSISSRPARRSPPSPVPTSAPAARIASYGDWAALSDECDAATAAYLKNEVSDGIIAPAYSDEALAILKTKKGGKYNIVQIDPAYTPAPLEQKDVFGITFEQGHNDCKIDESLLQEHRHRK